MIDLDKMLNKAYINTSGTIIPKYNGPFGSRYTSNEPHFQFVALLETPLWTSELGDWLLCNVGKNHETWEWWFDTGAQKWKFEFENEEDKVKFILRWL